MKKIISIVAVLVLIVAGGIGAYALIKSESPANSYASVAGPDNYNHLNFYLNHTDGGYVATSSAVTAQPLASKNLMDVSMILYTPNVLSNTLTLPASSTLSSFVPKVGDTQTVSLCNASTTAGVSFTVAFGTGLIPNLATSTLTVNSNRCATLTFQRKLNQDINTFFDNQF